MVRKALIGALAAGVLIATPVIASAATSGAAGTPTITTAALVRPAAADPGGSAAPATGSVPGAPSAGAQTPPGPAGPRAGHPRLRWLLRHHARLSGVLHAQWTSTAKDGSVVTHDVIHGTVRTASSGSITVTAADHTSASYRTSDSTAVWKVVEQDGRRRIVKGSPSDVVTGATVVVGGTGATEPYAANRILVQLPG